MLKYKKIRLFQFKEWMMRKITIFSIVSIMIILTIFSKVYSEDISIYKGKEVSINKYYTWGISGNYFEEYISPGEIVTNIKLTFINITNVAENSDDALNVYLVDNPPLGIISNIDGDPNNSFFDLTKTIYPLRKKGKTVELRSKKFSLLHPVYKDTSLEKENLVYNLREIDDPNSWAWRIYKRPFNFQIDSNDVNNIVSFSSSILEFIDYAGNGTSFGFGFDATGKNGFIFDEIIMEATIEKYKDIYSKRIISIKITNPPMILN